MLKKSKNKGITLIALVVTIIILLILAGISIGMLSGDNSIINQAGNAKTQTDIAGEKEIIDLAVAHAMGKSKYGDIDETYFTNELEKNNATVTKSGSKYKVTFTSGRQYTVDQDGNVKEKNPNTMDISEIFENGRTYFGLNVTNYNQTLDDSLSYINWQLFYAGALDGETEERIYLISKEYVKNTDLPTVIKNGVEVDGAKPIEGDNEYKACFGTSSSNGVLSQYTGTADITELKLRKLNSKYFKWLSDNDTTITFPIMKAISYMMDTTTWSKFKGTYADYVIGGPTVELLFTAYNKYAGTTYQTQVIDKQGYQLRMSNTDQFSPTIWRSNRGRH